MSPGADVDFSQVLRLTDEQAYDTFKAVRWANTDGKPTCAKCGAATVYEYKARRIFKCKDCNAQFSVTSGAIFASRKMDFRTILVFLKAYETAQSAHSVSDKMGCQYRTAWETMRKLRNTAQSPLA